MTQKLYTVVGSTGEYGDAYSWTVCVYADKFQADKHIEAANQWLIDNQMHYSSNNSAKKYQESIFTNPWDPNNSTGYDYTGADYQLKETLIYQTVEEFVSEKRASMEDVASILEAEYKTSSSE